MSDPFLSVIIPAFNEEPRLTSTLEQIISYLTLRGLTFEILVVDDGSYDKTSEIVRFFSNRGKPLWQLRLFRNDQNRGKGYSVRRGMLESHGKYALLTDADLSTPIEQMPRLEREVIKGAYDIAFGSRDVEGSQIEIHQSWFRESSGKFFNRVMRLLMGLSFHDTQCGFKLFRMDRCRDLFREQTIENFCFDVEILYIAQKKGFPMKEVPVLWHHVTGSKVRMVSDAVRMLWDLFRIRLNDLLGRYG